MALETILKNKAARALALGLAAAGLITLASYMTEPPRDRAERLQRNQAVELQPQSVQDIIRKCSDPHPLYSDEGKNEEYKKSATKRAYTNQLCEIASINEIPYDSLVVLSISSDHCNPCRLFAPTLEETADAYKPEEVLFLQHKADFKTLATQPDEVFSLGAGRYGGGVPRIFIIHQGHIICSLDGRHLADLKKEDRNNRFKELIEYYKK